LKPLGKTSITAVSAVTYLPFGPVSGYTLGNGQQITRAYDANYRLTDLTSPAFSLHVARDVMGDVTALGNGPGANPATENYRYDALNRLTAIIEADGTTLESVTYDPTGDRLSKSGSGQATGTYSYAPGTHQLIATGNQARAVDANGNTTGLTEAGVTSVLGYDDRNRLGTVQQGQDTVASYTYNALGQRVRKIAGSINERYDYDEAHHLVAEYGPTNRDYVWLDDVPVAVVDAGGGTATVSYVTADQLGTPRAVSDAGGTTVWQWSYAGNAWGEIAPTSSGYTFNLRFPGQYYDQEVGLADNGYRTLDASTGGYVQPDPLGLFGGQASIYAYVNGDPLNNEDPFGLASGRWQKVPGTNTWVRIDGPHVPGQQAHAHIQTKGSSELVMNIDGTASHGSDLSRLTRSKKVLDFLARKGFMVECLSTVGDAFFIHDLVKNVAADACLKGDVSMCDIYQSMNGGRPHPPID
jgi:RHS repeat-associated protein